MLKEREMAKLRKMLDRAGIPYVYRFKELKYPRGDFDCRCLVFIQDKSHRFNKGLLGCVGLMTPEERENEVDIVNDLTAEEVFERIINDRKKE